MQPTMGTFLQRYTLPTTALRLRTRRTRRLRLRSSADSQDPESAESAFAKELKRRGIPQEPISPTTKIGGRIPKEEARYDDRPPLVDDQLERSRLLNSEGLEGLIPRARELLTLGGTLTLSFLPAIGVVMGIAAVLYLVFGEDLVHFGRSDMTQPTYVNPYELLNYPYYD